MEEMFKKSVDGTLSLIEEQVLQIDHVNLKAKVISNQDHSISDY
jgi:hypothetical protein